MQTEDMCCWLCERQQRSTHTHNTCALLDHTENKNIFFFNGGSVVVVVVQDKRCYPSLIVPGLLWNSLPSFSILPPLLLLLCLDSKRILLQDLTGAKDREESEPFFSYYISWPFHSSTSRHMYTNTLNQHKRSISLILYSTQVGISWQTSHNVLPFAHYVRIDRRDRHR
jgi:hypothetical protein